MPASLNFAVDFEINKRGNLVRPISRMTQVVKSLALSVASTYVVIWLNGAGEALDELLPLNVIVGFIILGLVFFFIFLQFASELEFDDGKQSVKLGNTVIAEYRNIRQVEIIEEDDDHKFVVALRLGEARRYHLFSTNNEGDASLNAATIARAVGKPVQLVR